MRTKIFFVFVFVLSFLGLNAQKYITVEAKYLTFINNQQNIALITDNLRNSELVVDSIIFLHQNHPQAAAVLAGVTHSYFLIHNYKLALISGLRYFLFSNDSQYDNLVKDVMVKSAWHIKKPVLDPQNLISNAKRLKNFDQKLTFLLKTAIQLQDKSLTNLVKDYANNMEMRNMNIPFWTKQWLYFVNSGFSPKKAYKFTDFSKNQKFTNVNQFYSNLNKWQKFQVKLHLICH